MSTPDGTDGTRTEDCTTTTSFADHGLEDGGTLVGDAHYRLADGSVADFEAGEKSLDRLVGSRTAHRAPPSPGPPRCLPNPRPRTNRPHRSHEQGRYRLPGRRQPHRLHRRLPRARPRELGRGRRTRRALGDVRRGAQRHRRVVRPCHRGAPARSRVAGRRLGRRRGRRPARPADERDDGLGPAGRGQRVPGPAGEPLPPAVVDLGRIRAPVAARAPRRVRGRTVAVW